MKKILWSVAGLFGIAIAAQLAFAAPYPPALGGTGTSQIPASGTILIGNGSGTYTRAFLTPGSNISIANGSGTVTIAVTGTATGTVYLLTGGHGISLSPSSITASGTIAVNTSTVIADVVASGNFLASSTTYVATVNGQSGAVTIGIPATTTINSAQATVFRIIGDGTTATSTVNGTTTTFSIINTGNWAGTWQGVNSTTFYLASNPSGYATSTITIGTTTASGVFNVTSSGNKAFTITLPSNVGFFSNDKGYLTAAPATTTINGLQNASFTFSASGTGLTIATSGTNGITYTWTNPGYVTSTGGSSLTLASSSDIQFSAASGTNVTALANAFIANKGGNFAVGGRPFQFVGGNDYPLLQNCYSQSSTLSLMQQYKASGLSVIRTFAFNNDSSNSSSSCGDFDYLTGGNTLGFVTSTYAHMDQVVADARAFGLKLILDFTDQYGGNPATNKCQYVGWNNTINSLSDSTSTCDSFQTRTSTIALYDQFVKSIVSRTSTITGIPYASDTTVFSWELGNEMRYTGDGSTDTNANTASSTRLASGTAWYATTSAYLYSIDPNHLIGTGSDDQFYDYFANDPYHNGTYYGIDFNQDCALPYIGYCDVHEYPYNAYPSFGMIAVGQQATNNTGGSSTTASLAGFTAQMQQWINAAHALGKPITMGEYGVDKRNTTTTDPFVAYPRAQNVASMTALWFSNGGNGFELWHVTNQFDDQNYNILPGAIHTGGNANGNGNDNDSTLIQSLPSWNANDGLQNYAYMNQSGNLVIKPYLDSSAGISFQNASGTQYLGIDTTNGTINVPNNDPITFGGGSGSNSSIKTGTDGTLLYDTGSGVNTKMKANTGDYVAVTDGSFNPIWQAYNDGHTTQTGSATVGGTLTVQSTTASKIPNLDGQVYADQFPGSDIGSSTDAAYLFLPPSANNTGGGNVVIDVTSTFSVPIVFGTSGKYGNLILPKGTQISYTGTGSAVTDNSGGQYYHVPHEINGGNIHEPNYQPAGATTTAITCGGTNGCVTLTINGVVADGWGVGYQTGNNSYMDTVENSVFRNDNQAINQQTSNNSGENMGYFSVEVTDCGNNTTTKCFYLAPFSGDTTLLNVSNDDAQLYLDNGNYDVLALKLHGENSNYPVYGAYYQVVASTTTDFTSVAGDYNNDSNSSTYNPGAFIKVAGSLLSVGDVFQANGGQTITDAVTSTGSNPCMIFLGDKNINSAATNLYGSAGWPAFDDSQGCGVTNLSSTTVSGNATTTNLTITGVTNAVLGTTANGTVQATTSFVSSLGGTTGTVAVGAYLSGGATLGVSSTLPSSSVAFIFSNPTTTKPFSFEDIGSQTKKSVTSVDCFEYAAATTTMELYYNTTNASTGIQQVVLPSIACGIGGSSTSTFTTSTIPAGAYLFAIVSSTAGTPTQTTLNVYATKL